MGPESTSISASAGGAPRGVAARRTRAGLSAPVAIAALAAATTMLLGARYAGAGAGMIVVQGLAAVVAVAALATLAWREHVFARLAGRAAALAGSEDEGADPLSAIEIALDRIGDTLGRVDHRFANRHRATGLATREPLFAAIAADECLPGESALLGVVDFVDFDRLSAFDAMLAERALGVIADRIRRMIGASRLIAHVDRARIAIWFGAATPIAKARAELDAIGYALAEGIDEAGEGLVPQVRIGCATTVAGEAPQALLNRAIVGATTSMPASAPDPAGAARNSFSLEQDLRQAVARSQFELAFQPLIDATGRRVNGAEALLRWRHPEHGMISPGEFVPILEAAGLSEEVGLWVLNAAAREARRWRGVGLEGLRVAVNVSGHQLERVDLATLVERTLARHKLPGTALEIELTETVAAGDAGGAAAFFDRVRRLGVAVAIDDFGTGYSSLSSLRQLGFDKLKIDREFVTEVDLRPDSQAICQTVIALGRGLGIRVLAEGVERFDEYRWLRQHGCTLFQGYYFAPPLTPEAFGGFVQDRAGLSRKLDVSPVAMRDGVEDRMRA